MVRRRRLRRKAAIARSTWNQTVKLKDQAVSLAPTFVETSDTELPASLSTTFTVLPDMRGVAQAFFASFRRSRSVNRPVDLLRDPISRWPRPFVSVEVRSAPNPSRSQVWHEKLKWCHRVRAWTYLTLSKAPSVVLDANQQAPVGVWTWLWSFVATRGSIFSGGGGSLCLLLFSFRFPNQTKSRAGANESKRQF